MKQHNIQGMMTSVEGLTCQEKNARMHLSGCGIQLVSKKGLLTRTPALHLLSTHAGESSPRFTLSSSSSSSSMQDQCRAPPQPPQKEREVENLPPRRPLKLAPLELPPEVREGHRQKIKPIEMHHRKPKMCWNDPSAKSPERYLLCIITEPLKPQQRVLPVNQLKPGSDKSTGDEEAGCVEGNPTIKSHPSSLCQNNRPAQVHPAHVPESASQSSGPSKSQDAVKRRMRLRRTNRLEEDQSKSSSSTGGLAADEGTIGSAGPGKGQGTAKKALRNDGYVMETTSR